MVSRFLLLLLSLAALPGPAPAETIVVHAGRLIADASQRPRGPSTVTIVDGDPLQDIRRLERVAFVMARGRGIE